MGSWNNILRMDGETPDVRTCADCYVKRDLENFVGINFRAKNPENVKERSKKTRRRMRKNQSI